MNTMSIVSYSLTFFFKILIAVSTLIFNIFITMNKTQGFQLQKPIIENNENHVEILEENNNVFLNIFS